MLDEKRIKESKKRIERLLNDKDIEKEVKGKFVSFFLDNAKNSLDTAKLLFDVSVNSDLKRSMGLLDFNGFLWVINASYYSMFYMARALLEDKGIKIKTDFSIHIIAFDALIY